MMAPRAGKTTALAVPAILDAPGRGDRHQQQGRPVGGHRRTARRARPADACGCSTRSGSPTPTGPGGGTRCAASPRSRRPTGSPATSSRRSAAERGDRDFWTAGRARPAHRPAARRRVVGPGPGRRLRVAERPGHRHARRAAARARAPRRPPRPCRAGMHGAPETRDGVYETARTAAQCLRDARDHGVGHPAAPAGTLDELDAAAFPPHRQTALPAVQGRRRRRRASGGRAHRPDHAGGHPRRRSAAAAGWTRRCSWSSTRPRTSAGSPTCPSSTATSAPAASCRITILQSYQQGARVWGEHGMDALWSAATVKLIGAGTRRRPARRRHLPPRRRPRRPRPLASTTATGTPARASACAGNASSPPRTSAPCPAGPPSSSPPAARPR